MEALSKELIFEQIHLILLFGLLGFFTHWVAKSRGFFSLPEEQNGPDVKGRQVIIAFAIYLITALFIAPLLGRLLFRLEGESSYSLIFAGLIQLGALALILLLLILFSMTQEKKSMRGVWITRDGSNPKRLVRDFFLGIATWFIAFPLVVVISQICDLLLYVFFGVESYEQVAVRFLKMALGSPLLLLIALATVIVIAPIIEEWLFRGFLQSFLRKHVGRKAAILLTAFSFALFHLSGSQGLGNISLAISLFIFSCYLGFLYERQGSLVAPIGLHMAFNTVSSIRILLMPVTDL
ncbi:MAG: CPBP family intramembrane metalloprotease [Chlamydiales bacterium]|nr:CPBP family intramembrane metalloprotease [Chlamydiales bacterium]